MTQDISLNLNNLEEIILNVENGINRNKIPSFIEVNPFDGSAEGIVSGKQKENIMRFIDTSNGLELVSKLKTDIFTIKMKSGILELENELQSAKQWLYLSEDLAKRLQEKEPNEIPVFSKISDADSYKIRFTSISDTDKVELENKIQIAKHKIEELTTKIYTLKESENVEMSNEEFKLFQSLSSN